MRTILDIMGEKATATQTVAGENYTTLSDEALLRVAQAYNALFTGAGGVEDAELVLVDLAQFARYYDTASLDLSADQVKALDQRRAVFQRIMEAMLKTGASVNGLHEAVLRAPLIE